MKTVDYESLFTASPRPTVILDKELTVLDINDAYLEAHKKNKSEMIGKHFFDDFFASESDKEIATQLQNSLHAAINSETFTTPAFIKNGGTTFIIASQIIVDTVNEAEKCRLAASHKDEFLALLAHELRNPLSSINAATEILTMGHPDPTRLQKMTSVMKRQINLLAGLIDNLSDVSHLSKGLSEDKHALDIKHVIAEAVEQNSPFIQSRNHRLTVDVPSGDIRISGDHKRILQAITNLLINAAKYTPSGGNIAVNLSLAGEQVVIDVTDDGAGIPSQLIPNIFDLFVHGGSKTVDHSQQGLGIGLAVVKSIVEAHNGTVSVCSNGNAKGSRFEIRLPQLGDKI